MIDDSGRDWHLTSDWHLRWVKTPTLFSKTPPFFWGGFQNKNHYPNDPIFFYIYSRRQVFNFFLYSNDDILDSNTKLQAIPLEKSGNFTQRVQNICSFS